MRALLVGLLAMVGAFGQGLLSSPIAAGGGGGGGGSAVAGTANQITASGTCDGTTGTCTLSIPSSPAIPGSPTTTTQASTDNSTKVSTTAYVTTAVANAVSAAAGRDLVTAATAAVLPNTPTFTHVDSGVGSFFTSSTNSVLVVDGYTPVLLDRILVKNQGTAANNGIYYVSQLGVAAVVPWIMIRALDYDVASDINNTIVPVANHGTANALTSWIQTATVATVDTDSITFAAFTPNGANIVTASSPGAGIARFAGSTQTATSAELSGDCTTSGSNAVTCSKTYWQNFPVMTKDGNAGTLAFLGTYGNGTPIALTAATGPNSISYQNGTYLLGVNGFLMMEAKAPSTWSGAAGTVDVGWTMINREGASGGGTMNFSVYIGCAAQSAATTYGTASTLNMALTSTAGQYSFYSVTGLNLPASCAANTPMEIWFQRNADTGTVNLNAAMYNVQLTVRGN